MSKSTFSLGSINCSKNFSNNNKFVINSPPPVAAILKVYLRIFRPFSSLLNLLLYIIKCFKLWRWRKVDGENKDNNDMQLNDNDYGFFEPKRLINYIYFIYLDYEIGF